MNTKISVHNTQGQPEFTTPGFVSLCEVRAPVFHSDGSLGALAVGGGHTRSPVRVVSQLFFGNNSPAGDPVGYLRLVRALCEEFRGLAAPNATLVVNLQGWITGLGYHFCDTILALSRATHLVRDLSQLAASREEALTDELTGAGNRRGLTRRLGDPARHRRAGLLLVDLDRFKEVNDRHGHAVGDALLQEVASRFRGVLPADAYLTRPGGDEFAVVLGRRSAASAREVAACIGQRGYCMCDTNLSSKHVADAGR